MLSLGSPFGWREKNVEGEPKDMGVLHSWKTIFYADDNRNFPVVLGKGGQLSATIAFAGSDLSTAPDHTLYGASIQHSNVLAGYAEREGFVFHYDMTSAPSEYLRAPWFSGRDDEVVVTRNKDAAKMVRLIADERSKRHEGLVEPVIFVTLTFQLPKAQLQWFKKLLFGAPRKRKVQTKTEQAISEFNVQVNALVRRFSEHLGVAKRLNADRLYSYLYYTLTGLWLDIEAPKESGSAIGSLMDLERIDDENNNVFKVRAINQDVHVRVVTMHGMPDQIRPEFFEGLSFLGGGIRWSTRLKMVPANKVRKSYSDEWMRFSNSTQSWRQKMTERLHGTSIQDPVQVEMALQAKEDVKGTAASKFGCYLISSIVVYRTNEDDAEDMAEKIAEYIIGLKKPCTIEHVGTKVALSITLPGTVDYKFTSDLLADYPTITQLPCSLPYTGPDSRGGMASIKQSVAWQFTIKGTFPARVDFGDGQNRHVCITAPVRQGKSTLLEVMIASILHNMHNPFVYLLDVDVSKSASRIACTAMGGVVLSFKDGTAAVQPFRNVDDPERRQTAARWVKQCVRAHGLDDKRPSLLKRINDAFNLLGRLPYEHRTVQQFRAFVQDDIVRQCLEPFAVGDFSAHVGGNRNLIGRPPYVVIDCTGLMKGDALAACVVAALIDEITFTVGNHNGPVQCCIDEAVQVFPLIGESIDGAFKRWPKQGGGITIVIHDPRDLDPEKMPTTGDIIAQNTGAWVCLGDKDAPENEAYDKRLRLTEFQRALISELKKGDFMLKVGSEVRVIQTDLSPLEKWVLGQGGPEAAALAEKLDATCNSTDEFCAQLLKEGGFYEEAKCFEGTVDSNVYYLSVAAE